MLHSKYPQCITSIQCSPWEKALSLILRFFLLSALFHVSPQTMLCSEASQQLPLRELWTTSPKFVMCLLFALLSSSLTFHFLSIFHLCHLFVHLLLGFFFRLLFVDGGIQDLHGEMLWSTGILVAGFLKDFMLSTAAGFLYLAGKRPFSLTHLLFCKQNRWNWS